MNQPLQNPPVDRQYMRAVVGRQSPFLPLAPGQKNAKAPRDKRSSPRSSYLVGLTTFHIRPRLPR
jgi:hypothetical protein